MTYNFHFEDSEGNVVKYEEPLKLLEIWYEVGSAPTETTLFVERDHAAEYLQWCVEFGVGPYDKFMTAKAELDRVMK